MKHFLPQVSLQISLLNNPLFSQTPHPWAECCQDRRLSSDEMQKSHRFSGLPVSPLPPWFSPSPPSQTNDQSDEDTDSVWPPAGAKVRPPRRGKTPVFLFFPSHIPRCSHTLRSGAYDRQQSSGNYPSTPPPRIPRFLRFFKEGK
ncbi:hypothetical protein QQF64_025382 [Cirrhinus molitorella]|uniref:Uncharacterized protein n=1 Tax=Cirrhinus molitorella TaxID=172907 RepID=A0ABR3NP67_9TELE